MYWPGHRRSTCRAPSSWSSAGSASSSTARPPPIEWGWVSKRLFYLIQSDSFGLDKTLCGDTVHITHENLRCRDHDGADAVDDLAGQPDVAAQGALRHRPRLVPRLQLRVLHRHPPRVRRRPLLHQGTRGINNLHFRRGGEFRAIAPFPSCTTPLRSVTIGMIS